MQLSLCRHIKTNGTRCKAPSLTDGIWCYFHHRLHQRHTAFRPTEATRGYLIPGQHIELTALEDRESVQVALSVVINALATGQLDIKRATALLYGLQLASNNARGLYTEPGAVNTVRTIEPSPRRPRSRRTRRRLRSRRHPRHTAPLGRIRGGRQRRRRGRG